MISVCSKILNILYHMNRNILKLILQTGEVTEGTLRLSPMSTPTELDSVSRMSMSCSESPGSQWKPSSGSFDLLYCVVQGSPLPDNIPYFFFFFWGLVENLITSAPRVTLVLVLYSSVTINCTICPDRRDQKSASWPSPWLLMGSLWSALGSCCTWLSDLSTCLFTWCFMTRWRKSRLLSGIISSPSCQDIFKATAHLKCWREFGAL